MSIRPIQKKVYSSSQPSSVSGQNLGPFSGVAQDGPARKQRPSVLAEEIVTRGCLFIEKGIWDDAEKEFRKAIKMASEYPEAFSNLGLCLLYDNRPAEALEALQQSLRQFPGWSSAEANLALALQRLERFPEAEHYYKQSLAHKSNQPQVLLSLGDVLSAQGKADEAMDSFAKAAELLPDYALAHLRLGLLYARKGRLNEAESALGKAARLDSGLGEAHAVLGAIAARRGNIAQAKESFSRITGSPLPSTAARGKQRIELFETAARNALAEWKGQQPAARPIAEVYFELGLSLLSSGNEVEARAAFQKAVVHDPNGIPQQLFLAFCQEVQGDALLAKAALEKAEQLDPQNGVIPEQLGFIALAMGMTKEADVQFKKAVALGRVLPPELSQGESA